MTYTPHQHAAVHHGGNWSVTARFPWRCLNALLLAAGLSAALLASGAPAAQAADGDVTWSVQPANESAADGRTAFDFGVAAGTVITDHVAVTNFSATAVTFHVYAADAKTDYDTASFTLVGNDSSSTDVGSWTSVGGGPANCAPATDAKAAAACTSTLGISVTLDPGTADIIPFTVTVPPDATPGDHAAGIVAAYEKPAASGGSIAVSQRVGTRIYLRVAGETKPALTVAGAVAGYDGGWNPFDGGVAHIGFDLLNTGNTRVSAAPTATLTGPFGIPLGTVTADPVENLLPGGRGHVVADLPGISPVVLLFTDVKVTPQPAAGAAATDALPAVATSSAIAWAVPWSLLGLLLVIAAVIVGIVWWRHRSRERHAVALDAYTEQVRQETLASALPNASAQNPDSPAPGTAERQVTR